jgi:pyruvate kinase
MMDRIAMSVEADPLYAARVHFTETPAEPTTADAIAEAAGKIVDTVSATAIVCFTMSGSTARRVARERPSVPTARAHPQPKDRAPHGLLWGAHGVNTRDVAGFEEMVAKAKRMALRHGIAGAGDRLILIAGVPFGTPGRPTCST